MKPLTLKLQNFKSFKGETTFLFELKPGLVYVTGDNQLEPELQANGSGKSTVWDAISWVLFNKTVRGLKATDVGNWDEPKNTLVEFTFELKDEKVILKRTWNPNSLRICDLDIDSSAWRDITDIELQDLIGFTHTTFLNSVIIGQTGTMFLDLGPTDGTNLISNVMNLDQWGKFSEAASTRAKQIDRTLNDKKSLLSQAQGSLQTLNKISYDISIQKFEDSRAGILADHVRSFEIKMAELKTLREKLAKVAEISSPPEVPSTKTKDLIIAVNEVMTKQRGLNQDLAVATSRLNQLKKESDFLENTDVCPVCTQELSDKHYKKEQNRINEELATIVAEIDSITFKLTKVKAQTASLDNEIKECEANDRKLFVQYNEKKNERKLIEKDIKYVNDSLDSIDAQVDKLEKQENPWILEHDKQQTLIMEKMKQQEELEVEVVRLNTDFEKTQYWVKGFKDLRLFLISEALIQLEIEVNSALMQLGLVDWKIEFDIDSENKSGTVKRGFAVLITSPKNKVPVPFEAWSGGESQRLKLATQMGLATLITSSIGVVPSFEVWDEPSSYMTAAGVEDLLEVLAQRAKFLNKTIYVVDHHAVSNGNFERIITVAKDKDGSYFQ